MSQKERAASGNSITGTVNNPRTDPRTNKDQSFSVPPLSRIRSTARKTTAVNRQTSMYPRAFTEYCASPYDVEARANAQIPAPFRKAFCPSRYIIGNMVIPARNTGSLIAHSCVPKI